VKRLDGVAFSPRMGGWSVGTTYSDTGPGQRAVSAARLYLPPAPPLSASAAVPAGSSFVAAMARASKTLAPPVNGNTCPASTMVVDTKVPKRAFKRGDPDSRYKVFQSVCTRVEVEWVDDRKFQICLSVPMADV
jgi:hypothetical protein